MLTRSLFATALIGLGLLQVSGRCAAAAQDASAPKVVASIKPVHALVAGVMAGVAEPELLMEAAASPHSYALRPSQARTLEHADVVFWVGEGLENFLVKPLATLSDGAVIVPLGEAHGLRRLATREAACARTTGTTATMRIMAMRTCMCGSIRATPWPWWMRSPPH